MSWRTSKQEEFRENFKKVRDSLYAFILIWIIVNPMNYAVYVPVGLGIILTARLLEHYLRI